VKKLTILILIAALVLVVFGAVGCWVPSVKTTGGGWFTDDGHRIVFGFTAIPTFEQVDEEEVEVVGVKGQFQLIDYSARRPLIIHGEFDDLKWVWVSSYDPEYEWTKFEGTCTIKGEEGEFNLEVHFRDLGESGPGAGDKIKIKIFGWDGYGWDYQGELEGGNINIHLPHDYMDGE